MPTVTPNIGLQVPDYNQANWNTPLVYDLNLIDLIFGGSVTVPALNVTQLTVGNGGESLAPGFMAETPAGTVPGTVYTLTYTPTILLGFYRNGLFQRPGIDYTLAGPTVTMNNATVTNDTVFATYFK